MMSFLCIEKMTSDTVVPIYTIYTFTVQYSSFSSPCPVSALSQTDIGEMKSF